MHPPSSSARSGPEPRPTATPSEREQGHENHAFEDSVERRRIKARCYQSHFNRFVMRPQRAALVGVQGLPPGQGPSAGDVLHPTAVRDQTLLSHHLIEVGCVELGEAVLLGDVNLRAETMRVRSEESAVEACGPRPLFPTVYQVDTDASGFVSTVPLKHWAPHGPGHKPKTPVCSLCTLVPH